MTLSNKRILELLEWVKESNTNPNDPEKDGIHIYWESSPLYEILQHLLEVDIENYPGGRSFCGDCGGDLILDSFKKVLIDPSGQYHNCKQGLSSDEYRNRISKENKSQEDKEG